MSVTENITIAVDDLCNFGWTRLLMTGMLRNQLCRHFSSASTIESPALDDKIWTSSEATTKILIEDHLRWDPKKAQKRPGLLIKAGAIQSVTEGIGDKVMRQSNNKILYARTAIGSHTINCIAAQPAEAELLASEVYRFLLHFGPALRNVLHLLRFQVAGVGAPSPFEEHRDMTLVAISINYAWEETWEVADTLPLLHGITVASLIGR